MGLYDDDAGFQQYLKENNINLNGPSSVGQNTTTAQDFGTDVKRGVQGLPGVLTGLGDMAYNLGTAPARAVGLDVGGRPVSSAAEWLGSQTGFEPGKWRDEAA